MRNAYDSGATISATAPAGGLTSGQGVLIGSLFGVAADTAEAGERVIIALVGSFHLPKAPADTFSVGARLYWNEAEGALTTTAPGNWPVGTAAVAVGAGATVATVRLDGIATTQTPPS